MDVSDLFIGISSRTSYILEHQINRKREKINMSPLFYAVGASGHSQMTVQRYNLFFKCANKNAEILHLIAQSLVFSFPGVLGSTARKRTMGYAGVPISYKYSGAMSKRPSCQETVHPSNWN